MTDVWINKRDLDKQIDVLHTTIERLEAEIAALKEKMACGHVKACFHYHMDACYGEVPETEGTGEYLRCGLVAGCTACEHERLAVAAALHSAPHEPWCASLSVYDSMNKKPCNCWKSDNLDSDRSALDAHGAEVLDRALREAAKIILMDACDKAECDIPHHQKARERAAQVLGIVGALEKRGSK